MSIEPETSGAVDRVQAYIEDAHEWESSAFPEMTPQLKVELDQARSQWIETCSPPKSESIRKKMRERGVETLKKRAALRESLKLLGEKHWVGEAYFSELDVLASSTKHDPQFEHVVEAKLVETGRAEVITVMSGGFLEGIRRTYTVEKLENDWRIRNYREHSTIDD